LTIAASIWREIYQIYAVKNYFIAEREQNFKYNWSDIDHALVCKRSISQVHYTDD